MTGLKTILDLVAECDNFPYVTNAEVQPAYFEFKLEHCKAVLGHVLPDIAQKISSSSIFDLRKQSRELILRLDELPANTESAEARTKLLADHLQDLRESNQFEVLKGWRNELYPVYGPDGDLLFSMERSAAALFGIVTYGVHMTGYVETADGMKIWTPRRSPTKQTYPGMMDNTVAGGLSTGEQPFSCLIRESMEEASIPENIVRRAKATGTMTYFYVRDERAGGEVGLCQPEVQYVYDLILPDNVIPTPGDEEAVDFQLLSIAEVYSAMQEGKFKPNCAMLLVDFFVRHGIISAENEPDYLEIISRLHRRLGFPMRRGQ